MLKKLLSFVVAASFLLFCCGIVSPVFAAPKVLFSDDFSSGNLNKWINPVLDDDPKTDDQGCAAGIGKVSGGVLNIDNSKPVYDKNVASEFFYINARNLNIKNFTLTMKVKADPSSFTEQNPWLGVCFRKSLNGQPALERYNGCSNLMATIRFTKDKTIASEIYRNYAGASPASRKPKAGSPYTGDVSGFVTWRLEVNDASVKSYVNNTLVGEIEYKNLNEAGAIGIHCTLFKGQIDDIVITEYAAGGGTAGSAPVQSAASSDKSDSKPNPGGSTSSSQVQGGASVPSSGSSGGTESEIQPGSGAAVLSPKYKDVTVDGTFKVIKLSRALKVKELLDSFTLPEGCSLKIVDNNGTDIDDENADVTDTMKVVMINGGETVEYEINLDFDPAGDTSDSGNGGLPVGAVIGIVAVAVVICTAVVLFVLWKKGKIFAKKPDGGR